jgi:periodic tryptophan protein 2
MLPSGGVARVHSGASPHIGFCAAGHWKLEEKLYFNQRGARVSAADYHAGSGMLVVAFTNGIFDLYELPGFQNVHTLSVTRERISSAAFNAAGNWVSL